MAASGWLKMAKTAECSKSACKGVWGVCFLRPPLVGAKQAPRLKQRLHKTTAAPYRPRAMATTPDNDNTASLIPLSAVPEAMIEEVLDRAFGPERHARTAYRIRAGMDWLTALSFAALDADEMLVGTIQCWPVALLDPEGRALPLIMVGPVAVLPERQGEGFGQGLMAAMLDAESRLAADGQTPFAQMLIGDSDYYGRWGFSAALTGGWRCPGPFETDRLLARGPALSAMPANGMLGPWSDPALPETEQTKTRKPEPGKPA